MLIKSTPLNKAMLIEIEPLEDSRGYFARGFCKKTLATHGVSFEVAQMNIAYNYLRNTLRGMHFQLPPYCEDKIVSCFEGAIFDVIVDLNQDSTTFGKWFGVELSSENRTSIYVPKGFAHGYLTLTDNVYIQYMVSEYYTPSHESGLRWDDKTLDIEWPIRDEPIISSKDMQWFDFNPEIHTICQK
ncbi:dTDP-4-dehydrorhamnose 3,5-epimerase [Paenibacillus sp. PL2-23]|uniref:dTDP-4-dehydrorhamnose 3,5-epimerase n=1 Tax=Paenibacillus sp. PL2-23 TaxID=2100729 RepID=UPI0030F9CD99